MANVNYLSPAGLQPKLGWQPSAGLAGMLYYDQNQDYRQVMDLQKIMGIMDAQQKVDDRTEYGKNAGVRDAERQFKQTKATVDNQNYGPLAQLDLEGKGLDVGMKRDTYSSTVKAKNAQNEGQVDEETLRKAERGISKLEALAIPLMNAGPLQMQMLEESEMPPQLKQYLQQATSPEEMNQRIAHILKHSKAELEARRKERLEKVKGDEDYRRAIDVARIQADALRDRARIANEKPTNTRPMTSDQRFAAWVEEQVTSGQMTMQEGMEMIARLKAASKQQDPAIGADGIIPRGQTGNVLPPIGNQAPVEEWYRDKDGKLKRKGQ